MPTWATQCLVRQHAIDTLTTSVDMALNATFSPRPLLPNAPATARVNFKHFMCPMVHPVTGETISSYKTLMHDLATAEVWQTAFSKDLGGMAQGDKKMDQKGTDAMFVMTHRKIK